MPATMDAAELARLLGTEDAPFLLDVRQPEEVAEWAIPGARNIPLAELPRRITELPTEQAIVTVCASGTRSFKAAELLDEAGFRVSNLVEGMAAWSRVYDVAAAQFSGVELLQVRRRGKGCLSYLVGAGDEAFVIDPSADLEVYLHHAASRGWTITRVFDTHLHADHLSGARSLALAAGATLHLNAADPFDFPFAPHQDGDVYVLPGGSEFSVSVLHTPGHTEGSTVFRVGEVLLSGDTLFVDGVGRPDLAERAEAFARNLHASLQQKILPLPDDTLVLPAHYSERVAVVADELVGARLGALRAELEPLSLDEDAFVAWAIEHVSDRPPNYRAIVEVNRGLAPLTEESRQLEVGPNRCSA